MALRLPYFITETLLACAGHTLLNTPEDALLRQFIDGAGLLTVRGCNAVMEQAGFGPLTGSGRHGKGNTKAAGNGSAKRSKKKQ